MGEVQNLTDISEKTFSSKSEEIDKNVEKVIASQTKSIETVRTSLTKYEDEMLELVGSRIEQVKVTATAVMGALSEDIEDINEEFDNDEDDSKDNVDNNINNDDDIDKNDTNMYK